MTNSRICMLIDMLDLKRRDRKQGNVGFGFMMAWLIPHFLLVLVGTGTAVFDCIVYGDLTNINVLGRYDDMVCIEKVSYTAFRLFAGMSLVSIYSLLFIILFIVPTYVGCRYFKIDSIFIMSLVYVSIFSLVVYFVEGFSPHYYTLLVYAFLLFSCFNLYFFGYPKGRWRFLAVIRAGKSGEPVMVTGEETP